MWNELPKKRVGTFIAAALFAGWLGGCSPDVPLPHEGVDVHPAGGAHLVPPPDVNINYPNATINFDDAKVAQAVGSSRVLAAAAPWGAYFGDSFVFGGSGDVTISIRWEDDNDPPTLFDTMSVCGLHHGPLDIRLKWGLGCGTGNRTPWSNVDVLLRHEIGHSLGFNSDLDGPYTSSCVMNPNGGAYNSNFCDHELQWIAVAQGARGTYPADAGYLVDSIAVYSDPSGLMVGDNATLHVLFHVDRDGTSPVGNWQSPIENGGLSWSAFGNSDTVQSIASSGTTSGTVTLAANGDAFPLHEGSSFSYSLAASAVPTPSDLDTTHVDTTSASIAWTNGTSHAGMYTVVQLRLHPSGTWSTTDSVLASSQSSRTFTGLADSTAYDVQVRHVNGDSAGHSSTSKTFTTRHTTTDGPPVITFFGGGCFLQTGSPAMNDFRFGWTITGSTSYRWELVTSPTNDPATADDSLSGRFTTSADFYYAPNVPNLRYFWLRYYLGSTTTAWSAYPPIDVGVAGC